MGFLLGAGHLAEIVDRQPRFLQIDSDRGKRPGDRGKIGQLPQALAVFATN